MLDRTAYDFLDTARYLVAGIAAASLLRALYPAGLAGFSLPRELSAICGGIGSAYVLSLCSAADAFVARAMFSNAPMTATLSFLVMGPMLDLKNTILLSRFAKPGQVLALAAGVALTVGVLIGFLAAAGALG
jgi:uncharacterized membrane protein YraQ (UPF0718 family)